MALRDYVQSIKVTNNTNNVLNTAISGKTYVSDYGNNYWTIEVATVPMTRANFFINFTNLFNTATSNQYSLQIPVLNNAEGTVAGVLTVNQVGVKVGATSVNVSGGSGTLSAGDFIKFSNHTKVYQLTDDITLTGSDTLEFYPSLVTAPVAPTTTVLYDSVFFTVKPTDDSIAFDVGTVGYYQFQQSFREVK